VLPAQSLEEAQWVEMRTTNDFGRSRDVVDQTSARFGLRRQTGFFLNELYQQQIDARSARRSVTLF
jgi:hypothetical protein